MYRGDCKTGDLGRQLPAVLVIAAMLAGQPVQEAVSVELGVKIFPTPRTYDSVGTVFRVGDQGILYVTTLGLQRRAKRAQSLSQITLSDTVGTDIVLQFIKLVSGQQAAQGTARARLAEVTISAIGTMREFSDDVTIKAALNSVLARIDFNRGRYYVIAETIFADSVSYAFDEKAVYAFGGKLNFSNFAIGDLRYADSGRHGCTIVAKLKPPQRVFYKVEEIKPRRGAALDDGRVTDTSEIDLVKDLSHKTYMSTR